MGGYSTCHPSKPESVSAISANLSLNDAARTVDVAGNALPLTSVIMSIVPFVTVTEDIKGTLFTANPLGYIDVNADAGLIEISCEAKGRYGSNDSLILGVGIGDPSSLPLLAGANPNATTYVSRFSNAKRGEGANRTQSLSLNSFAFGREQIVGAKAGDKIFPVLWTEQPLGLSVIISDLIFVVKSIKA